MRATAPWTYALSLLLALAGVAQAQATRRSPATTRTTTRPAPTTAPVYRPPVSPAKPLKPVPETAEDLRALQAQVKAVVARVAPAVVGLRVGGGQGSGVIISEDGYVLTAGHVCGAPDRDVMVILADGRMVRGLTLGVNYGVDSGLVKIMESPPGGTGKWPFAEMGKSTLLRKGQWCIAMGHPGGFKTGRTPPVRLGRMLDTRGVFVRTDCTLVGGDSGGPLFDLDGRVIAIHSRIGGTLNENMHVPVDTYRDTWDKLSRGEAWGATMVGNRNGSYLGVQVDPEAPDCRVGEVFPDSPAQKAGLKAGDVIKRFGGRRVANFGELLILLAQQKPGDEVDVDFTRDDQTMRLKVTIGRRPDRQ
jgi:serine protease Do